jgi:predicted nucleic acid-binding protein
MKAYWDASALVSCLSNADLRARLQKERGFTRTHSLSEIFSALTGGNLNIRVTADRAAEMVEKVAVDLDFIELNAGEVIAAFKIARAKGVRGGRVHDFLHARAAEKSGAADLVTSDRNDFTDLSSSLNIVQV